MNSTTLPHLPKVVAFRQALSAESDRGCALLAAAFIDEELRKLITSRLVDDQKLVEQILFQNGPLGAFSARIDFTYAIGLLGKNIHRDLHLVRKIRNDFGHSPEVISFDDASLTNRCKELHHTTLDKQTPARKLFINTVVGMLGVIHGCSSMTQHFAVGIDLDMSKLHEPSARAAAREMLRNAGVDGA